MTFAKIWNVYSEAPISKHRSKVGPFYTVEDAAKWVTENRANWNRVSIISRKLKTSLNK